ncbi:TolC family protein [Candidatus Pelagibacter sp.]|nr:TolC family protein [Candidatus Pelagibacter sp.]
MIRILIILSSFIFLLKNANAETFSVALSKAFKNNSELNAERENIIISEQELKISQGNYLPTVTLSGSKSQEDTNKLTNQSGGNATVNDVNPFTRSISISQTLIDFGRGVELSKSRIGLDLAKAKLLKKEQDILFKSSEAYTGLVLANERLKINRDNVELLSRQVETDQIRVERGLITLSDVSQSESSLAEAQAKLIQAENDLLTSKLNYENIIGSLNDSNSLDKKSIKEYLLPDNLNSAIELSKKNNPDLIIAKLEYEQAKKDKTIAKSDLAPTANLSLERSYTDDFSATYDEREKDTLKATITWPFYSGGKNLASLNKSSSLETRSRLILDSVTKQNQTNVASAWSNYQSNKSLLDAVQSQVKAAEIANEGITAEYNSGSGRTTLEVIQSNSLLLNAQISLANSERNFTLSKFNLLKSMGLFHSEYLKIR